MNENPHYLVSRARYLIGTKHTRFAVLWYSRSQWFGWTDRHRSGVMVGHIGIWWSL